ncbi:MAG: FAD-dependent oxidoreductase [Filomicrobium sp.]
MTDKKSAPQLEASYTTDLLIVGGGIVGLWCAQRAAKRGLKTTLIDKGKIGQGASGGFLGALMPHQPVRWSEEKQYQLEALLALENEVASLEEQTGINCGYLRSGRVIPTRTEKKRAERLTWRDAAKLNWPAKTHSHQPLQWRVEEEPPTGDWLASEMAPLGYEFDTMTARVAPRQLVQALRATISPNVKILENTAVTDLADGTLITLQDGSKIAAAKTIVAAGHHAFPLIENTAQKNLGRGVKGQAALLKPLHSVAADQPIIYFGGVYIIAHDNGLIAIGSTSEKRFTSPTDTDHQLDDLIEKATELCQTLEGAEVVERWAGVRPNATGRHPMIGPLPIAPNIIMATGGFKISFGVAHKMADDAIAFATGEQPTLPKMFQIAYHEACAK